MKRKYELKKRAERQAETRQRIVEATVALHTTEGPARTTVLAIAQRAGVQRHTVYAHFPDENVLYAACTAHWDREHPFPDPQRWEAANDPLDRLGMALDDVYAWYDDVADAMTLFIRDAELVPPYGRAYMRARADELAELAARLAAPISRRKLVRVAVAHALSFETWRSLVCQGGLTRREAVGAMLAFVSAV